MVKAIANAMVRTKVIVRIKDMPQIKEAMEMRNIMMNIIEKKKERNNFVFVNERELFY